MSAPRPSAWSDRSRPMDRRTAIRWILSAAAAIPLLDRIAFGADAPPEPTGYGPDPDLQKTYAPGELWPLTFSADQRRTATALCDTIIPADAGSPSASQVGVVDFLDEWISAPYWVPFRRDRGLLIEGLAWIEGESATRFQASFADLTDMQRSAICDDICDLASATAAFYPAALFFARFRALGAGGFYTTPEGTRDLRYVGNIPMTTFDGPPLEVLRKVGLA